MNKYVIGMYARRFAKLIVKTNIASLSWTRSSSKGRYGINNVFMLMYHRINDYRKNEMSVPVQQFRKQLTYLKKMGFQNMRMDELELMEPDTKLKSPKVILSFDDGYEDNFTDAFPILKEFGYSAIFYLPYNFIGKDDMYPRDKKESNLIQHNRIMDWTQIKSIHNAGMEIGSHTLSHQNLTKMNATKAKKEIFESKNRLEQKLGLKVTSFCYPGGYFNEKHVYWTEKAGYLSACTTANGCYQNGSKYKIPRIAVLASDTFFIFKQKLIGDMNFFNLIH